MLNIQELIKEAHQNAIDHGFYDCPECKTGYVKTEENHTGLKPCEYCNGTGIDTNKNIGELLMLIVSELGEALEAHRKNKTCTNYIINDLIKQKENIQEFRWISLFEHHIKDTFEDEIADVFIRLFDLCGYLEIDNLKNIGVFGNLVNIGESLLLIAGSLYNFHQNWLISKNANDLHVSFGSLLWLCDKINIPIEKHIEAKMAYNKTRPHKHGKSY